MAKILASAEAFGFGPASKLHAVSAELSRRGVEVHFVGSDASLTFARSNAETFASIMAIGAADELARISANEYDGALSVMDPYLTLWARINGVPCVYVDSLYWFWQWLADREPILEQQAMELATPSCGVEAFRALGSVPMHDSQYIAHFLSTASCVQNSPSLASRTNTIVGLRNVEVVEAVIDLSHRRPGTPDRWVATTSGMINPLLPFKSAVDWTRIVSRLLEEAAALSGVNVPVTMAGNPDVLAAADVTSDLVEPMPMNHGEILSAMNGAIACLTPPGLTTMLECAAYDTPFLLLPEQHYGHLSNYRELSSCGDAAMFPHGLIDPEGSSRKPDSGLHETLYVSDRLKQHFSDRTAVWSRMVHGIANGMSNAYADRERIRSAQEVVMRKFAGGYAGAGQVADVLESALK